MREGDISLLEESFKKYYFDHFELVQIPENPTRREFGYQRFDSGMTRHLSINDDKQLRLLMAQNTPSDVYCSNGYYLFPNLPMAEKDWQGADLIFDIDAKDLNLPCRKDHTIHKCVPCGSTYAKESACPRCQSPKHELKSLPCLDCIGAAKHEVRKLLHILSADFGIDQSSIQVFFSGNEGFHVYAYSEKAIKLSSKGRAAVAEYVMFKSAIPERFGFSRNKPNRRDFPELEEGGWRGRVARELFGPKSRRSKSISGIIAAGHSQYAESLQQASAKIGVCVDLAVTTDIHRIFRLPGSLNSKSGMAKVRCTNLDSFDPYREACLIGSDEVNVVASTPVEFKLGGKKFGPYDDERVVVPRFAAVYMICKGLAATP